MTGPDRPERPDLLPLFVLAGLALLLVVGWLLFPWLQRSIARLDCIAAGYTNCDASPY